VSTVVVLQAGVARARLLPEFGGRVSALLLATGAGESAVEVLHPYPEDFFDPLRWGKGGIYPLLPYSNRVAQARVRVDGAEVELAPHPDAAPHTLHGNAHTLPWGVVEQQPDRAVMVVESARCAAWPWRYTGRQELQLSSSALTVSIAITNTDERTMPAGIGLHPYFVHEPQARIGYHAGTVWPPTSDFLALFGRAPMAHENHVPPRALRPGGLTDYVSGWGGWASIELPGNRVLALRADPVFGHLVVHRPDSLAYLCLEPASHVADGFNLAARGVAGTGTRWLAPGESLSGAIEFSLRRHRP